MKSYSVESHSSSIKTIKKELELCINTTKDNEHSFNKKFKKLKSFLDREKKAFKNFIDCKFDKTSDYDIIEHTKYDENIRYYETELKYVEDLYISKKISNDNIIQLKQTQILYHNCFL
jgi:hypothetical protein